MWCCARNVGFPLLQKITAPSSSSQRSAWPSVIKAPWSIKMLVTALPITQYHILDDKNLQQHCCPPHYYPKSHIQLLISGRYSLVLHCVAPVDISDIGTKLHSLQFLTSECSVQVTACGFQSNMVLQYKIINEHCCENLKNHSIPNVMTSKKKIQAFKNNYIYIFILWKDTKVLYLINNYYTQQQRQHYTFPESIKAWVIIY